MNTQEQKTSHYWRIHARVCRRLLSDLPKNVQDIIANDASHVTEQYQWFENKVAVDAERLYLDSAYYDNAEHTFRIPKHEQAVPRSA